MSENAEREKLTMVERVGYAELIGGVNIPDKFFEQDYPRQVLTEKMDNSGIPVFKDEITPEGWQALSQWLTVRPTEGDMITFDPEEDLDESHDD